MTLNHVSPCTQTPDEHTWQTLVEFTLSREPGSARLAVDRVAEVVQELNWPAAQLEQLRLALAQATRKAAESSYRYDSHGALVVRVLTSENDPAARENSPAGGQPTQHEVADRQVQQVAQPSARGWGFFLIEKTETDPDGAGRHVLELFLYPEGKS